MKATLTEKLSFADLRRPLKCSICQIVTAKICMLLSQSIPIQQSLSGLSTNTRFGMSLIQTGRFDLSPLFVVRVGQCLYSRTLAASHSIGSWANLELSRFLRFAVGLAAALGKLHQQGLIHKHIKPANILVDSASGVAARGVESRPSGSLPPEGPAAYREVG